MIRENGPSGSCFTQMSRRPSRDRPIAIALPSGESEADSITPCGSQPGSTGVTPPSMLTHTARRDTSVPPVV